MIVGVAAALVRAPETARDQNLASDDDDHDPATKSEVSDPVRSHENVGNDLDHETERRSPKRRKSRPLKRTDRRIKMVLRQRTKKRRPPPETRSSRRSLGLEAGARNVLGPEKRRKSQGVVREIKGGPGEIPFLLVRAFVIGQWTTLLI